MRVAARRLSLLASLVAGVSAAACSSPPPPISTHNLERPSDLTFGCMGLFDLRTDQDKTNGVAPIWQVSGRPMAECHKPGFFDVSPPDIMHRTFGYVANSARGDLSVIDMDASKLVDLDLTNPGTNVAPLGVLPEQIAASDDGCQLVSANRGSCDLTLVDPGALLTATLAREASATLPAGTERIVSQTVVVRGTSGPLHVAPHEVLFLPQDTSAVTGTQNLCSRERPFADPIGWNATPTQPQQTQWKALVSFPTCNLVALVNLPSGDIVDSVRVNAGADGKSVSLAPAGADPSCPVLDCVVPPDSASSDAGVADAGSPAPAPDAAAPDDNSFVSPAGVLPGPLAILPDGKRAYVGLGGASFVAALDLAPERLTEATSAGVPSGTILLHEAALGADRLRLSVDPYLATGAPGQFGRFVGEGVDRSRQFLYVLARDGTVRVVDVSRAARQIPEVECDTNVDPQYLTDAQRAQTACFAVTDGLRRRPEARGPGIRLPALPRDVAFADLKLGDNREGVLDGVFGFILTSSGATFIVNIDPTLRTMTGTPPAPAPLPETPPLVNSLRDRNVVTFTPTLDPSLGPPRVDLPPVPPVSGPQLQGIPTTTAQDNATDTNNTLVTTYVFLPERTAVRAQHWSITWEGTFIGPAFGGQFGQQGGTLTDAGVDFCQAGALGVDVAAGRRVGDTVSIFGCTADQQCGPQRVCLHSTTAPKAAGILPINGLCVALDPTRQAQQLATCAPLLDTVRRYEIVTAGPRELTLRPKIDEVPNTLLTGCATDADCHFASDPSREAFVCRLSDRRCVQPCDPAKAGECRAGRTCVDFGNPDPQGRTFCADAPPLSQGLVDTCLAELTAYTIQVGGGFSVQGSAGSPFIPRRAVANVCVEVPASERDPLLVDRIPLNPPACTNATINLSDPPDVTLLPVAHTVPAPDPCRINVVRTAGTTSPDLTPDHARVLFQNWELRFVLTNLEEYASEILPILFDVHGGFLPETVFIPGTIDIGLPIRIVTSPLDSQAQLFDLSATHEIPYMFVVDQRRLGNVAAGVGATRGQVLRINPRSANSDQTSLFAIFEDPSLTGGLWPIQ
jgi:hypothetical protein